MDLTPYLSTLREDLATAASAGDDDTRRTAAVLSAALEPAARLAIMNALSDLAAEVTAALDDRIVEVRLDGRDVQVVVNSTAAPQDDDPIGAAQGGATREGLASEPTGDISRITLRLFEEIKSKAEDAASAQGVSLNSWVSQAVQGALQGRGRGGFGPGGPGGRGGFGPGAHGGWTAEWPDRPGGNGGSRLRGWVQG